MEILFFLIGFFLIFRKCCKDSVIIIFFFFSCMFCDALCDLFFRYRNHIIRDHFFAGFWHIFQNSFFQIRCNIFYHFRFWHGSFVAVVINRLLYRCQCFDPLFQFECTDNIFALSEPHNQIIASINTFLLLSGTIIKFCKLIGIFFRVFFLIIFFQNLNLILDRRTSASIDHIFQKIT